MKAQQPPLLAIARPLALVFLIIVATGGLASLQAQETPPQLEVTQDTSVIVEVELRDGTKLRGRVVAIDGEWVTFETVGGVEHRFRHSDVVKVEHLAATSIARRDWKKDGGDSRLFVGPTARVPDHGHGYAGIYELIFPSAAVGLANVAMIGGGFSIVPGLSVEEQVYFLSAKVRFLNIDMVQAAVGAFLVGAGGVDDRAGLVYGTVTAGSEIASFTGSLAFPFYTGSDFESQPIVTLGAEYRVSRVVKLITENWFVPGEDGALFSLGIRGITGDFIVEFAGVVPTVDVIVFPLVSFAYTW
jgi:hypothetical protein